jgi:hypothetical protein
LKTCIHFCDISFVEGSTCSISDRVNGLTYCIELATDEIKDVEKCKNAAIVFIKHRPEKIKIKVK